uniref:ATP synthase CF1 subunit delta n=1 Tax=Crouania attenuata TaxID=42002 RepID=A0A4D6WP46_9FLOR|nr:ATP synthase CF1 subunit delta [Crouania attenuata]
MSTQNLALKVATPYAEALLELAKDMNILSVVTKDLSLVSNILSDSNDLQTYLSNPLISISNKKNVLNQIFQSQLQESVLKFLLVLVERRRITLLSVIIDKYLDLAYKSESTTIAEIITSTVFTEQQESDLINKIKLMTNSQNVKLLMKLDSNLIAGFIIKIGSKIIDTSLYGKLNQMSLYLNAK